MPDMIWQGTSQLRKWIEMNEQVMDINDGCRRVPCICEMCSE